MILKGAQKMENVNIVKTVPAASMVMMGVAALASAVMFFGMMIWAKKKMKASLKPFFTGCAVFILFVMILESIMHNVVLKLTPVGDSIMNNSWLYALYGGLAAGIFEETGRFLAFKTVLKKSAEKRDSLVYGMGHGGVEALLILGLSMVSAIAMSVLVNMGMSDMLYQGVTDPAAVESVDATIKSLTDTAPYLYSLSIIERLSAVIFHIAASVLVYAAALRGKTALYPLAILLHAVFDAVAVLVASTGLNLFAVEGIIAAISAAIAVLAYAVYKGMKDGGGDEASSTESAAADDHKATK